MSTSDPYRLTDGNFALRASLGGSRLDAAVVDATVRSSMNDLPSAQVTLDTALLAGQPVDYFAPLEIPFLVGGGPEFSGYVRSAVPSGREIQIECQTMPRFVEDVVPPWEALGGDQREIMHLMARLAGLGDDAIHIEGIRDLDLEMIEVLIPIEGVSVSRIVRLGPVSLVPPPVTEALVAPFSLEEGRAVFEGADCHALYRAVGRRMFDAEMKAMELVDATLSWIVTRGRYGLTHLPSGEPQRFVRARSISSPRRADYVISRGLDSGKTWLRGLAQVDSGGVVKLDSRDWLPPEVESFTDAQRLGMAALRSAIEAEDPLARVQALFQAVEFYVAGIEVPPIFGRAEARRIRRSIPKDVDPQLRDRALDLLGKLNDPSLMLKLQTAVRRDGVPLADHEMDLLSRVRTARNDTVHGRAADAPTREDIDHAVSLVARLLLHGLKRRTQDDSGHAPVDVVS